MTSFDTNGNRNIRCSNNEMMSFLKIEPGMKLLSIRSSDIAFTMGAYGRLAEESMKHEDEISVF